MSGKLIVLEGLDGSGKSTQLERLPDALARLGIDVRIISFPDYNDPSSTLIKMYLSGEFGENAGDVNAYAASIFYAADRYASYVRHWKEDYENGRVILAGRYVSSNAIHQTAKLPREEWEDYTDWLVELEYDKIGIPEPDMTLFLDMPAPVSERMLSDRYLGDESKRDLHERDGVYMENCRAAARFAADRFGWEIIPCSDGSEPYSIDAVTKLLVEKITFILGG